VLIGNVDPASLVVVVLVLEKNRLLLPRRVLIGNVDPASLVVVVLVLEKTGCYFRDAC
jgi:hypothetical protein